MKTLDEKEQEFYNKVLKFLTKKMGFDDSKEVFTLNSGDNSVLMKGELAGHSLSELKEYIAKVQEKKIEWDKEDYY